MLSKALGASRYLIIVAVSGAFLAATKLLVYQGLEAVQVVASAIANAMVITLEFIEIVDLFLLWTEFYIISEGLYELFRDDRIELPT